MRKGIFLALVWPVLSAAGLAQTATRQVYCVTDADTYLNGLYKGRTSADRSGILLEDVEVGEVTVQAVKSGHLTGAKANFVEEGSLDEIAIETVKEPLERRISVGADLHFGMFGLFNVNDDFTKASYSFGVTPYVDYRFHPNFAVGGEVMSMWGKPATADHPRWMLSHNLRMSGMFTPFRRVGFNLLVAGGFSYWPENPDMPELTPTLNDNRFGWDVRAMAGVDFLLSVSSSIRLNFGYWASSTTSDDVVWITHDTMIMGLGYGFRF